MLELYFRDFLQFFFPWIEPELEEIYPHTTCQTFINTFFCQPRHHKGVDY
jgi:hypothetical protein